MNAPTTPKDRLAEHLKANPEGIKEKEEEYTCKDIELQIACMQRIVEFFKEVGDPNKTKFDRHKYLKFRNTLVNTHGKEDCKEKNL